MHTRPTRAGLTKLHPRPPKSILTMMMAMKSPISSCQIGIVTGTLKAMSTPVTTAERSAMVSVFFISRFQMLSSSTQLAADTAVSIRVRKPKITVPAISAGQRAMSTSSMTRWVVAPCLW